jgi:hypothetical protein
MPPRRGGVTTSANDDGHPPPIPAGRSRVAANPTRPARKVRNRPGGVRAHYRRPGDVTGKIYLDFDEAMRDFDEAMRILDAEVTP